MKKRFMATYKCNFCGTDERHYFIAENEEQVEDYMEEGLIEYAETWTHLRFGWDNEYTEEEFEEWLEKCGYFIEEINEDALEELYEDYNITEDDFEDLT